MLYVIDQPFDERNYRRLGIERWQSRGWHVEVWDLTSWLYPAVWRKFSDDGRQIHRFSGYHIVGSMAELRARIARVEMPSWFIDALAETAATIAIKSRLADAGLRRVIAEIGSIPEPEENRPRLLRVARKLVTRPLSAVRGVVVGLQRRIAREAIRPRVVIVAGRKSFAGALHHADALIIKAHNEDYDTYLALRDRRAAARSTAVFLDQNYPFHSDALYTDGRAWVTPVPYFGALKRGLDSISQTLHLQPEIAAHPRSAYLERGGDYFAGVAVRRGATAEMVQECRCVVAHNSTAVQLAVLFRKPVIFVTTDELENSTAGPSIRAFARELGRPVMNLDHMDAPPDWTSQLVVDEERYAAYIDRYIKMSGTPEHPYWDIVATAIEDHVPEASLARS